jgi:phospholipid/cholesterol/gamma-HCH transport system substrate-binding protein
MRQGHEGRRLPNWAIGLILVVVVGAGSVLAYSKTLPWADPYEVQAVFTTAQNVRTKSPVRIAGVQVGEVTGVESLSSDDPAFQAQADSEQNPLPDDAPSGQQGAVVTMKLDEEALPLREDAQFQLRPRLFLEGNLFVDVKPGSPNAPEVDEGHQFGMQNTSTSVQLDQVLTTLQGDVRADLKTFLDQFGNALIKHDGAQGFQELYRSSPGAYKYTSQVNEALQGTEPHDLSGLIRNLDRVVAALDRNEAELQGLVTNFRVVTGSFAAESDSLQQAIGELPDVLDAARPAFASLNDSFPDIRAFAREALPGVRSTAPAIRAATPFVEQARLLLSKRELRGLVDDLRPTIPSLARLSQNTVPFLNQARSLSSCFNEVIVPWSNDEIGPTPAAYPYGPRGTVAEETAYGLVGIAGESRSGDANGQYIRVEAGGGASTIVLPGASSPLGEEAVSVLDFPLLGAMPRIEDSKKTEYRPGVPCETQEPPDLGAGGIFAGDAGFPNFEDNPVDLQQLSDNLQDLIDNLPVNLRSQLKQQTAEIQRLAGQGDTDGAQAATLDLWQSLSKEFPRLVDVPKGGGG